MMISVTFLIIGVVTLLSAVAAMSLRNLVHCALCLMITFAGIAALYLQLGAQFVGLAQILVYIGAVAILIVFAILLTRSGDITGPAPILSSSWWVGIILALAAFGSLVAALNSSQIAKRPFTPEPELTVKQIGGALLEDYVLPLEVAGLLLTAAMIGAVIIAMHEKRPK